MNKKRILWLGLAVIMAGLIAKAIAADFLGADEVLKAVLGNSGPLAGKTGNDELTKFNEDVKTFAATETNLSPADAAKQWLALVDRSTKLKPSQDQSMMGMSPFGNNPLMEALPPPADWDELAKAIAARPKPRSGRELPEIGLRLLAATLTGDKTNFNQQITQLSARAKDASALGGYQYRNYLEQIDQALVQQSDNPDTVLNALERSLNEAASSGRQDVQVPNLVAQVGREKAEAFLRRALVTPNAVLNFNQPNETSDLAQKLALELMAQLKVPQWGLVNSLSAVKLYEAMNARFPPVTNRLSSLPGTGDTGVEIPDDSSGGYEKRNANIYYLLGLINDGRTNDAVAIAKKTDDGQNEYGFDEAFKAMQRAGLLTEMDNFFNALLTENPGLRYWDQYVEVAAQAGQTERMLATVRKALTNPDLKEKQKEALHLILVRALLANDNVDEAVSQIRLLMQADDDADSNGDYGRGQGYWGAILARLGVLLEKPEWTEEGIKAANAGLAKSTGKRQDYYAPEISSTVAHVLFELNRGPEAEAVLEKALATATHGDRSQSWSEDSARQPLTDLAILYHRAGRPADVLKLLEKSPDWGVADVSSLSSSCDPENLVALNGLHTGASPLPVTYLAAEALYAEGKTNQAQAITYALLDEQPGLDRGYELLLKLQGTNAIPKLDELFKRDQFEERPLIWKAHLLRGQNQLEDAEKLLRQAINIDPSDGEEGRGDRMRVYAELAEVRAARGDQKEADFFREVVTAIRMSEHADQLYSVGLLSRAVALYAESLKHFSDAYCIQSRIAIQMAELGMTAEAEKHYQRAYELMPDSFGRVESHCFGCERAFDGEKPQSIAEKVFTKMAADRPDKPQIHYLLGYLRKEQSRYNEARTNFLAAVQLDPEYLNAWIKLQEVGQEILMPPKERDKIAFNILRLDPLQRHGSAEYNRVSDLAGLWSAVATAAALQPQVNTNLFELTASKAALEKKQKEETRTRYYGRSYYSESAQKLSPAGAVASTPFVQVAVELIFNREQDY